MRRFLCKRVIVGIAVASLSLLGSIQPVFASDNLLYPWIHHEGISTISRGNPVTSRPNCGVRSETIRFRSGDTKPACVYGDIGTVRVAFYEKSLYWNAAAISFPGETTFVEIRGICEGSSFCGYSAAHDVFLDASRSRFYPDFAKNLVNYATVGSATPYYLFTSFDTEKAVHRSGIQSFNAASVSQNGNWAIVEAYDFGLIRVNLKTFQERRVLITGAVYGLANDPWFELAISNSGREVAITGKGASTRVIQVDEVCGDTLTPLSAAGYYVPPAVPCEMVYYSEAITPVYQSIHAPAFNRSGDRLSLSLKRAEGWERIVIAPTVTTVNQEPFEYMALGDSFSSGEGDLESGRYRLGTDVETNKCHLSNRSYPYLMMRTWAEAGGRDSWVHGQSVACSGAKTKDVTGVHAYYGQKNQVTKDDVQKRAAETQALADMHPGVVRQVDFVSKYQPKFVTLGIGGNDAGLMGKLNTCIGVGVCEWVKDSAKRLASAKEIQALYGTLRSTIAAIRGASPGVHLMILGYPRIINEQSSAPCSLIIGTLLSYEERKFMDESIILLNDTIRAAAHSEGVTYVDVQDAFTGQRLCEGSEKAMNGVAFGDDIAPIANLSTLKIIGAESFHPTPYGHTRLKDAIRVQIPRIEAAECANCSGVVLPRDLSSYWMTGTHPSPVNKQRMEDLVEDVVYRPGQLLSVSSPLMLFRSQAKVVAEIHSEPKLLGEMIVGDNGAGELNARIPEDIEPGYHTLHLTGEGWSGETVDAYQVIRITDEQANGSGDSSGEASESRGIGVLTNEINHVGQSNDSQHHIATLRELGLFKPAVLNPSSVLGITSSMQNSLKKAGDSTVNKEKYPTNMRLISPVIIVLIVSVVCICIGTLIYHRYINSR